MPNPDSSFVRVRYWGLMPSPELRDSLADATACLGAHRAKIERCSVQLGRWLQHHGQGYSYRISVEIERRDGGQALSLEDETELNASVEARHEMIATTFARAASRLGAS